jgi:hypothetical protein
MLFLYSPTAQPYIYRKRALCLMKKHDIYDCYNNTIKDIVKKEMKAVNVGLSLNIMTKMATDIRYRQNIVDLKLLILELLLGYHTYGTDRYRDDGTNDNRIYIYDIAFILIIALISSNNNTLLTLPIDFLIYSTKFYKDIKPYLGVFKSVYVASLWTISIIILPSILHDNSLNILQEPLDYLPFTFLMISTSNNMDIEDIEDDKNNNIQTIPVKYGVHVAKNISTICMILFTILLSINLDDKFKFFLVY